MNEIDTLEPQALLGQLLSLSRTQRELLENGQFDGFLTLFDRREVVLRRLAVVYVSPPDNLVRLPGVPETAVTSAGDDADSQAAIALLVAAVQREDEQLAILLRSEMWRIKGILQRFSRAHATVRGYAGAIAGSRPGRVLDVVR